LAHVRFVAGVDGRITRLVQISCGREASIRHLRSSIAHGTPVALGAITGDGMDAKHDDQVAAIPESQLDSMHGGGWGASLRLLEIAGCGDPKRGRGFGSLNWTSNFSSLTDAAHAWARTKSGC
jgi:hypothetical protein